ncbi:MAG: AMP-binding protein [Syntrophomonadaceae bacterium]|nr:AMP-binding protein [Syntrophomonadaceae bacterium]
MEDKRLIDIFDEQVKTIPQLLYTDILYAGDKPATHFVEAGEQRTLTYNDLVFRVECLATSLIRLGFQEGDRIATMPPISLRWVLADLAIVCAGAISVSIVDILKRDQLVALLKDSASRAVVLPNASDALLLMEVFDTLPDLDYVFCLQKGFRGDGKTYFGLGELYHWGEQYHDEVAAELKQRMDEIQSHHLATIVYVESKPGKQHMAFHSHGKLLSTSTQALRYFSCLAGSSRNEELKKMATIPVHQIMGKLPDYFWPLIVGASIDFTGEQRIVKGDSEVISVFGT